MTFKNRVHNALINGALVYKSVFVDYDYLIYSKDFKNKPYYIISANEDNYPHLTGVTYFMTAQSFYTACINGTLQETDFDFSIKSRTEKEVIGSVRRKIQVLPLVAGFFSGSLHAEEDFSKGSVFCSLATADNQMTIGFVDSAVLRPKTLLKKNELDAANVVDVTLILRRNRITDVFDTVMQGDSESFRAIYPELLPTPDHTI
jgi:hypothetical protein